MNASDLQDGTLDQGVHLLQSNVTLCTAVNISCYAIGGEVLASDGRNGAEVPQCYQYVLN